MTEAELYQVWVDGEPTKALSNSFDTIQKLGENCVVEFNKVEIQTTNGPSQIWLYNQNSKTWDKIL